MPQKNYLDDVLAEIWDAFTPAKTPTPALTPPRQTRTRTKSDLHLTLDQRLEKIARTIDMAG
jgi:hypothetical protein